MATRNVSKQASALAKARERRRALDKARDEQDQRIEEATAGAFIALEVRADAERALESATCQLGKALKLLLAEDVSTDKAAALLELKQRRFAGWSERLRPMTGMRTRNASPPGRRGVVPDAVGDRVARQAG